MARHNRHVIARQILQLAVPSVASAHTIQQAAAQRLRTHTLHAIEALFDRLAGPEHTLRINHLVIDLGNLSGLGWQAQFESRLLARLTEALKQAIANETGRPAAAKDTQDAFEVLLFFLRHGRLPSWAVLPSHNWAQYWVQELDAMQLQSLRAVLTRNGHARLRLIYTLDDTALRAAVERLYGLHDVLQVFTCLFPATLPRVQQSLWRTQFWQALLDPVTTNEEPERGRVIMQRLLQLQIRFQTPATSVQEISFILTELPEPWQSWLVSIQRALLRSNRASHADERNPVPAADSTAKPSASNDLFQTPTEQSASLNPQHIPQAPAAASYDTSGSTGNQVAQSGSSVSPLPLLNGVPAARDHDSPIKIDEAIDINGAGCIILHPFLEELFRRTELLDKRDFRDAAARGRAVRLVSRLCFGDEMVPEYELLLPKLLCDMAWETPLPPVELSAEEHGACDALLDAVLEHWQALQGCSANWMREQFFLRAGTLAQVDQGWRLSVTRHAQDVLLDRLPWGLGVVALPWRRGLIYVRWKK